MTTGANEEKSDTSDDAMDREKKRRREMAMKQREKAIKTISSMQSAFVKVSSRKFFIVRTSFLSEKLVFISEN